MVTFRIPGQNIKVDRNDGKQKVVRAALAND